MTMPLEDCYRNMHNKILSSSDSLIPSSVGVKKQAGQVGNTAHAAPNIFSMFQKTLSHNPLDSAVSLKQFSF
jgi:hypothetical protein